MDTVKNINDDYIDMFVVEEEDLTEGKTFYIEADDGGVLCKYNKWNASPSSKQVKWFGSYQGAKNYIAKNHLGVVNIKDHDFTKKDFGDKDEEFKPAEEQVKEYINPIKFDKIVQEELKDFSKLLSEKYGQPYDRTKKVILKHLKTVDDNINEAFSPNQNQGDVKVTMVFNNGKFVNWAFDGKPKTKDMLEITKKAPFIKNNLRYDKEKKIFMWKKGEQGDEQPNKQGNEQPNKQGNDDNKDKEISKQQTLKEASKYE